MVRASRVAESPDSNSDESHVTISSQLNHKSNLTNRPASSILSPASSASSDGEISKLGTAKDTNYTSMSGHDHSTAGSRKNLKRPAEWQFDKGRSNRRRTAEADEDISDQNYDPDQDIEERRTIRRGLRDLSKNLAENRSEYLNPDSTGLEDTISQANNLSKQVKQTSDATIDSSLLVTAADITYKRTVAIISGEAGQGIDLDDFINKCKDFMRKGDLESDESRRKDRETIGNNIVEEDEDHEDEILNWEYLGRHACVQHIGRPCVPGFLLGPISTEKKAKRTVVRKATLRIGNIKETRPDVLQEQDIVRDDDLNLSTMCQKIAARLEKVRGDAMAAVELETRDDMTDEEAEALLDKYSLSREAGITLFKFVINPYSFSQSIENLFYVSFLIRDSKMAVTLDSRGLPYLGMNLPDPSSHEQMTNELKNYEMIMNLVVSLVGLTDIRLFYPWIWLAGKSSLKPLTLKNP